MNTNPYERLERIGRHATTADLEAAGLTPTGNAGEDMRMLAQAREHARKAATRAEMLNDDVMVVHKMRDEPEQVTPAPPCPRCGRNDVHSHVNYVEGWL